MMEEIFLLHHRGFQEAHVPAFGRIPPHHFGEQDVAKSSRCPTEFQSLRDLQNLGSFCGIAESGLHSKKNS